MKGGERVGRILYHAQRYVVLFLMISFVVTCCMAQVMEVTLTGEHIEQAAKLTFFNIMRISTLFTIADSLRHKWMVERPVRQIVRAAERIMQGDFSVRIAPLRGVDARDGWGDIAHSASIVWRRSSSARKRCARISAGVRTARNGALRKRSRRIMKQGNQGDSKEIPAARGG